MGFPERIKREGAENADHCAICHEGLPPDAYKEWHSALSLHVTRDEETGRYRVNDTPEGFKILRGRTLDPRVYARGETEDNDAFCVCVVCHDEVKRIALAECRLRNPNFKGNTSTPAILEEITLFCVERGKPIVYDNLI